MKRSNNSRFHHARAGGTCGLLSATIGGLGLLFSYWSFTGYSILENMVSELGTGPGGIYFNLSVILSGLIAIPYYITLAHAIKGEIKDERLKKSAIIFSIISCIAYCFIGVFPARQSEPIILLAHGIFAAISISSGVGYFTLFSVLMMRSENFSRLKAYLGFIIVSFYSFFLLSWWPIIEWMMSILLLIWVSLNSLSLYYSND